MSLTQIGAVLRDDNDSPVTSLGLTTKELVTFTGNNTTVHVPIFTITGAVQIQALYGVVTTVLGVHTVAYFRLNDQTNQSNITASGGTTLSSAAAGSVIVKKDLASAAVTLLSASQERVSEPTTLETLYFSPFVAVAKPGATTQIEYTYSTTDAPTTGAMTFYCQYLPIGSGSTVSSV